MATHKHCTYIKQRRKSRFIFPWQVQDHITCHTKCKALNHRARFSLHTTARHKLMSLYQFISKSLVWAWVCLIEWTPTWARFGSDFVIFQPPSKVEKKRKPAWVHTYPFKKEMKCTNNLSVETTKTLIICCLWNGKVLGESSHFSPYTRRFAKLHLRRQVSPRHYAHKYSLIWCSFGFVSGGLLLVVTVPEGRRQYRILFRVLCHAIQAICSLLAWCHTAAITPVFPEYCEQQLALLLWAHKNHINKTGYSERVELGHC